MYKTQVFDMHKELFYNIDVEKSEMKLWNRSLGR